MASLAKFLNAEMADVPLSHDLVQAAIAQEDPVKGLARPGLMASGATLWLVAAIGGKAHSGCSSRDCCSAGAAWQ